MAIQIRNGQPGDFPLVMQRVVTSFGEHNPGHLLFEELYPDAVIPETMGQWRLAFIDEDLAGGMQLVPRPLHLAGSIDLPAIGLGNVFCFPPYRGQGVMSSLLKRCIADMEAGNTPVCLLGGDRARYGNFGWEHAGVQRPINLSQSMHRYAARESVSACELRAWDGNSSDLGKMYLAHGRLPYACKRSSEEDFANVLRRPGQRIWICDGEEGFAYASLKNRNLVEYAGDKDALEKILKFFLRSGDISTLLPPVPGCGELEALLLENARSFSVSPTGMVRVNSLFAVFQAYLPLLGKRLQQWRGSFSLGIDDGDSVCLADSPEGLKVEAVSGPPEVTISRREAALLLFGPFPPGLDSAILDHPLIRQAFPLPLFWSALDHV